MGWLDANCGANNWAITPAGLRGVVNDALAIYFLDAGFVNAFVTRWCLGYRIETVDGNFGNYLQRQGDKPNVATNRTFAPLLPR
jgi:hypothetical protein